MTTISADLASLNFDDRSIPALPSWTHSPARESSPAVHRFCERLHPQGTPIVVPVRPDLLHGAGPYPMGRCYDGVGEYIERVGGTFQQGWMVWELEGIYLRAYHHCVHRDGPALTDVSFQLHREILFLPTAEPGVPDEAYREAARRDDPDGVKSRYFPLSDSALARRIIGLHEAKDRAGKHSTEWFRLLGEVAGLERSFHEWEETKAAAVRRWNQIRRRMRRRM